MSHLSTALAALKLVPGWDADSTEISELKGGLTNHSFYVRSGDQECVLRINAQHTSAVMADRSCELAILDSACKAGIAPAIVYSDIEAGILLTEYLPGPVWQATDLEKPGYIESLAEILRQVHALPPSGFRIDLNLSAARYEEALQERHGLHDFASRCVGIIRSISGGNTFVCCHNDVVAGNLIGSTSVKMIDWEYAGDNNPLFDLASVIGYHDLGKQSARHLLSAYAGSAAPDLQEQLADQLRLYDAIQWLWLATRHRSAPNRKQAARLEELQQRIR